MPNPWFRMYTDFLEDPKLLALAFEDQRHFIGVLALKSAGTLDQDCSPELMDRLVAQRLWIDHSAIREVKRRLFEAGLIDQDWQPVAWDKRQFVSDSDPTAAERARRYRQKQKKKTASRVTSRTSNGSVTPIDTDTDTETDTEKSGRATRLPPSFPTPAELTWANENEPAVDARREAAKFRDHWTAASGARATKKDWPATWRNWIRRAAEYRGTAPKPDDARLTVIEQAKRMRAVR